MDVSYVVNGKNINKKFKGFELNIENLEIPKGYATALIGENGAGKTTLLNILAGISLDYKGELTFFEKYSGDEKENQAEVKEKIGYTGPGTYYLPNWSIKDIDEISQLMFKTYSKEKFESLCKEMAVFSEESGTKKKNSDLSDGTKMKVEIAGVMARQTEFLVMDEPASPLDPLMRDKLCEMIGRYIDEGNGEKSVFFSTHNVSDMENITDYAIIMAHGNVVEAGFVEELKEKYVLVKGEAEDKDKAKEILYSMSANPYGFEGICLAKDMDKLAGLDVTVETPSLFQISVAVMKANSNMTL